MAKNGVRKVLKIIGITLAIIIVLFIGLIVWATVSDNESNNQTTQTPEYKEIEGEDNINFLNFKFVEYSPWQADLQHPLVGKSVQDVIYSGSEAKGYKIGLPQKSIKPESSGRFLYSIDIFKLNDSQEQLIAKFVLRDTPDRKDGIGLYKIIIEGGSNLYLDNALEYASNVFPHSFFEDALAFRIEANKQNDLRIQTKKDEEYAATHTPEGWPKDSIYNSILLLRSGILDFHEETVGKVFYTGKRVEGVVVSDPKKSGRFQIVTITSTVNRSVKFDIYLNYDNKSQMSLIEKIEVKDGNKTTTATKFEEKYAVLLMILPIIMNEGNLGY